MRLWAATFVIIAISALAATAQEPFPNYRSCAVDYVDNFMAFEDVKLGVPVERLQKDRLNGGYIAKLMKEQGGLTTLMSMQRAFAECVRPLGDIRKRASNAMEPYRQCTYVGMIRIGILTSISNGRTRDDHKSKASEKYHQLVDAVYAMAEDSKEKAAFFAGAATRDCITKVMQVR